MKRYIFTEKNNRGKITGNIFRIKDNDILFITSYEASAASRRGGKHDVFNALINCGEIPKKWYTSSKCAWIGDGYFYGEVEKHYDIKEAF